MGARLMPGDVIAQIAVEAVAEVATEMVGEMAQTSITQEAPVSRAWRTVRAIVLLALAAVAALVLLLIIGQPFSLVLLAGAVFPVLFLGIFGVGAYRDLRALLF